jgi:hypothetical protein
MGNLNYSPTDILLNSVSVKKVGLYMQDLGNGTSQAMLLIKDAGISIPGAIYVTEGGYLVGKPLTCAFNCVNPGRLKIVRYVFHPICPCEECNYEYGITIQHKDSSAAEQVRYFPPPQKFLGGKFERVECTGGFINDSYVNRMELDIIRQAGADPYSFVNVWRSYNMGDFEAGDAITATISLPNNVTIDLAVTWTGGQIPDPFEDFLDDINTALGTSGLTASGVDGNVIITGEPGLLFSIDGTYETRYLYIGQKYPEVSFSASYTEEMATAEIVQEHLFPSLRGVDVYKEFMNKGNHGNLALMAAVERPDPSAEYCKWTFVVIKPYTYDLVGANHLNQYYHTYHLYVRKDAIIGPWDEDMGEGGGFPPILYWENAPDFNVEVPPAGEDLETSLQDLVDILCGVGSPFGGRN